MDDIDVIICVCFPSHFHHRLITYIEELAELCEAEVCFICAECADLHIRLLEDKLLLGESFRLHQILEPT